MKSKFVSFIFLFFSIILLGVWSQINNQTKEIEKQILSLKYKIKNLQESNKVLITEYTVYTSPKYIKKMSSIYLDNEINESNKNLILTQKNFFERLEKIKMIVPVSSNNQDFQKEFNLKSD
tara:strand:- start:1116 stop:1478 length:363 start_codon:yes stop_codon:yes gene_type:complete